MSWLVGWLTELVGSFHNQKALMSCPVFLDFIGLNCKCFPLPDYILPSAHNDIKRKIRSELLNRSKDTAIGYDLKIAQNRKSSSQNAGKTINYTAQSVADESLLIIENVKLKKNPVIEISMDEEVDAPRDNTERIQRLLTKLANTCIQIEQKQKVNLGFMDDFDLHQAYTGDQVKRLFKGDGSKTLGLLEHLKNPKISPSVLKLLARMFDPQRNSSYLHF